MQHRRLLILLAVILVAGGAVYWYAKRRQSGAPRSALAASSADAAPCSVTGGNFINQYLANIPMYGIFGANKTVAFVDERGGSLQGGAVVPGTENGFNYPTNIQPGKYQVRLLSIQDCREIPNPSFMNVRMIYIDSNGRGQVFVVQTYT